MSEENIQDGFGFGLILEFKKLKTISTKIKGEIKKEPIDRLLLKEHLFEIGSVISTVSQYLKASSPDLQEKNFLGESREHVIKVYEDLFKGVTNYAQNIDNIEQFPDSKIRNDVFMLITGYTVEMNSFETYCLAKDIAITPFAKIMEFTSEKLLGLDETWAAAACHLSAFDILVNKKRKELGIAKKPEDEKKLDFYTKFDALVKELESNSGELSKITKQMPKLFWPIRVDVIHYGYVPSAEELDLIINWSKSIMKVISDTSK